MLSQEKQLHITNRTKHLDNKLLKLKSRVFKMLSFFFSLWGRKWELIIFREKFLILLYICNKIHKVCLRTFAKPYFLFSNPTIHSRLRMMLKHYYNSLLLILMIGVIFSVFKVSNNLGTVRSDGKEPDGRDMCF